MARQTPSVDPDADEPPEALIHTITRFWVSLLLIVLIAYGTVLAIGRSAGFRDYARQRLEDQLGIALAVEAMRLTPTFELVLEGVKEVVPNGKRLPAIEAASIGLRIRWSDWLRGRPWPFRACRVVGLVVHWRAEADQSWQPWPGIGASLLGVMRGDGESSRAVLNVLVERRLRVALEGARLGWFVGDALAPVADAEGIVLDLAVLAPRGEPLVWGNVQARYVEVDGRVIMRDGDWEWISLPEGRNVLLRGGDAR